MAQDKTKAALALLTVLLLISAIFAASKLLMTALGLPTSLGIPPALRFIGAILVVAGLAVAAWTFRYRSPIDMAVSTYVTFVKLFRGGSLSQPSGRNEPLVVVGAQRYTRNPLYFGVVVMTFGWALVGEYTFVMAGTVFLLFWFRFILIPLEERELEALFGDQYRKYAVDVPMLVPFTKRRKRSGGASD